MVVVSGKRMVIVIGTSIRVVSCYWYCCGSVITNSSVIVIIMVCVIAIASGSVVFCVISVVIY